MGVTGLWPILEEFGEKQPLSYLSGKKVAVDLSGWIVRAYKTKGLKYQKNCHLKLLFSRVSSLLKLDVHPIFVMDGEVPAIKRNKSDVSRENFTKYLVKKCQDLLNCLGVPCIMAHSEAERFCAFLNLNGVVDGVITEDNDALLYGADVVYTNFSSNQNDPHIKEYSHISLKSENFKRDNLVVLALLLGGDYSTGVPDIGKETALKFFSQSKYDNILQRFKDWKSLPQSELFPGLEFECTRKRKPMHCSQCGHAGTSSSHKKVGCITCDSQFTCYLSDPPKPCKCPWHRNEELREKWKNELKVYKAVQNFRKDQPEFDKEVIEEYLNYTEEEPSDESLDLKCPDMAAFQESAFDWFEWTCEYSFQKVLPLITSWQLFKLKNNCGKVNFIYEPVNVVKEKKVGIVNYLEIEWEVVKEISSDSDAVPDNVITLEDKDRFSECYKEIVENFYKLKPDSKIDGFLIKSRL